MPPATLAAPNLDESTPPIRAHESVVIATEVIARLRRQIPELHAYDDRQWARTREDIAFTLRFAIASLRFRDDGIFTDYMLWLGEVLRARHVTDDAVRASFLAIADAVPEHYARVGARVSSTFRT